MPPWYIGLAALFTCPRPSFSLCEPLRWFGHWPNGPFCACFTYCYEAPHPSADSDAEILKICEPGVCRTLWDLARVAGNSVYQRCICMLKRWTGCSDGWRMRHVTLLHRGCFCWCYVCASASAHLYVVHGAQLPQGRCRSGCKLLGKDGLAGISECLCTECCACWQEPSLLETLLQEGECVGGTRRGARAGSGGDAD